jgi:carbonic anhydrase
MSMKRIFAATAMAVFLLAAAIAAVASSGGPGLSADEAQTKLTEGNTRFVSGASVQPHQDAARRQDTASNGQHPFATVLACADSRVPPEVVFDQGLGDLFVVRVAGNVAATDEIGSIEYAADHLGTALVVVLGHTKCGAVTAVVKNESVTENIGKLVAPIVPAVAGVRERFSSSGVDELIAKSIEANVWQGIADMYAKSPLLKKMAIQGKVKVVGAIYDVDSGQVHFLGEHPNKNLLLEK